MTILVQQQLRELLGKLTTAFWRNDGLLVCPAYREGETVYVESWRPLAEASTKDYARFIAAANPGAVLALLDEIDQLKAENAELRIDAARFRHVLQQLPSNLSQAFCGENLCHEHEIAEAIDQAMTKEQP